METDGIEPGEIRRRFVQSGEVVQNRQVSRMRVWLVVAPRCAAQVGKTSRRMIFADYHVREIDGTSAVPRLVDDGGGERMHGSRQTHLWTPADETGADGA